MTRNFISFFFLFLRKNYDFLKMISFFILLERIFAPWNGSYFVRPNIISWGGFFFRRKEFHFVGTHFCLLERMLFRETECCFMGRIFFRRKEFHFVGTNFCLLERMLISWERMLFRGEEFFFRRNEFLFESTQADVLKMSCCPLSFGITPPQQTKQ